MAPIVIHGLTASAPCRILTMTCEVLGLEYEFKICNLQTGDNKTPEYLKVKYKNHAAYMLNTIIIFKVC